jgi:hypothetical protein
MTGSLDPTEKIRVKPSDGKLGKEAGMSRKVEPGN